MGKTGNKLPNFCLSRIKPHVRVPIQSKLDSNSAKKKNDHIDEYASEEKKKKKSDENEKIEAKQELGNGRKIVIVVDSSFEAEGALQWALSHCLQNQDKLVLLHVIKPSRKGQGPSKETAPRAFEMVHSLRNMCQLKKPQVEIEVAVVEGKEKGPAIVEEARKQGASVLVLGQKKRSTTWRLLMIWASHRMANGGGNGGGVVEYCIQNAECMAIAVRRKSKKLGGYLITTKRQKDFWLLA